MPGATSSTASEKVAYRAGVYLIAVWFGCRHQFFDRAPHRLSQKSCHSAKKVWNAWFCWVFQIFGRFATFCWVKKVVLFGQVWHNFLQKSINLIIFDMTSIDRLSVPIRLGSMFDSNKKIPHGEVREVKLWELWSVNYKTNSFSKINSAWRNS